MKIKSRLTLLATAVLLTLAGGSAQAEVRFYVAPGGNDTNSGTTSAQPFKTLSRAQQAVRELKQRGPLGEPVTVQLGEGVYPISETLRFTPEDSGTESSPVTYTAAKGVKAVLSGGRTVTGWKRYKDGIWVATLPEVKAGNWWFRQLYVNGEFRGRARTPNKGVFHVKALTDADSTTLYQTPSGSFEYFAGDIDPKWKNPQDAEVIVYHYWTDAHLPVAEIDGKRNVVSFQYKSGKVFRDDFHGNLARYIVENVYEALDQPGEWVLNRTTGQLFYMPRPGEDMTTVEVIAPFTEELISIKGDPLQGQFVEYLNFEGLAFEYSNFNLPWGNCNDGQGSASVHACINLSGARNCSFDGCMLRNLGTFGVELFDGCTFNRFTRNTIEQVAAGGFRLRGVAPGGNPALRTGNNTISDNTIGYYGLTYPSAVGILVMHSDCNTVTHNLIHHGDYTGISVGWSWGYLRSAARGNLIAQNHIHDIGYNGLLSDMGGIYTLGLSPGTVIRNNLVHDVNANRYGGWGIYTDEGSTSVLVENNIVYHTKFGTFNIHYAKDLVVRNNIFAMGTMQQLSRSRVEPHTTVYFEGNIVYWTQGKLLADEFKWQDKTYKLYGSPFNTAIDTSTTFVSDWNLFYNPNEPREAVDFSGRKWEKWQAEGKDIHSIYANPMFVDPDKFDFRLLPDSPALKLGFRPIDMTTVGPRKDSDSEGRYQKNVLKPANL